MEYLITREEIESTDSFKKIEQFSKNILLKLSTKKTISHGLITFRATKKIPGYISGSTLVVLNELIKKEAENVT